jgi:hypothetical protein
MPLTLNFELADQQYSGSKFIMTWRELDSWLASREGHVQRNLARLERGAYRGKWTKIDREAWTQQWHAHRQRVLDYFAARPGDLLVINICGGEGYERLCPFLNKPIPAAPFPWMNRRNSAPPVP